MLIILIVYYKKKKKKNIKIFKINKNQYISIRIKLKLFNVKI